MPRSFIDELIITLKPDMADYEEIPVDILTFINDEEYFGQGDRVYPEVKTILDDIFEGNYDEAVLICGIGAGKTTLAAIAITYMIYRVACLKDPQKHYGLIKDSWIAFALASRNRQLAKDIIFTSVKSIVDNCKWFGRNCPTDPSIHSVLRFPKKKCAIIPGSSSAESYLGYNLLGGVIDEASWLDEIQRSIRGMGITIKYDAAEEIYNAMHSRIKSRFLSKGLIIMISSPRYIDDFLERKYREARESPEIIYARRAPVWEIKPKEFYSGKTFRYNIKTHKII